MTSVLLATDADWIFDEVAAALCNANTTVSRIRKGREVTAVMPELIPDLVVLDLQIGTKGGVATALDLRHDADAGRIPHTKVLMLLDRDADRWLARQAKADGWLVKPIDAFRLRRAANAVLAGETFFEGDPVEAVEADPAEGAEGEAAEDLVEATD